MPVTPFHLGPLMPLKAVVPRHFSLGVFAVVQVVIDLESIWNIVRDNPVVHDRLHTLLGAMLVAALGVAWAPVVGQEPSEKKEKKGQVVPTNGRTKKNPRRPNPARRDPSAKRGARSSSSQPTTRGFSEEGQRSSLGAL